MDTEKLRAYCLSLPGVHEGIKWEDHLCFMVAEKMFCITGMTDASGVSFKVSQEDFEELTERNGHTGSLFCPKPMGSCRKAQCAKA